MTKIYEALQYARGEASPLGGSAEERDSVPAALPLPVMFPEVDMEEEMMRLHQNLDTLLPDVPRKIVQFIGSREGEGTSTVVHEFARVSATRFGQRVLLLDANSYRPMQNSPSALEPGQRELDGFQHEDLTDLAPYQIGDTSLFSATIPHHAGSALKEVSSPRAEGFWVKLKQRFDLVLVDSLPAAVSSDGLAISSKVDGVILVMEAETTRWPVAENLKDAIIRSGGKVLGVVFNKRRYYIPGFIYKRL